MKCCNNELNLQNKNNENQGKIFFFECSSCGKYGEGKTKPLAEKMFNESSAKDVNNQSTNQQNMQLEKIPRNRNQVIEWSKNNMPELINQSAQFIEKPATQRMIEKNMRYVSNLSGKSWDKIWDTEAGQESISHALSESLYYAATLPEMGSIVPFGKTAEFVPSVECFEFAMLSGKNAPFSEIKIYPIHQNDTRKAYQENENFTVELEYGIPRGEVIAIVVQAKKSDTGKFIGEIYDVERLIEKAKHHSPSYKSYLKDKEEWNKLKTTGKLDKDKSGRECIKKNGKYGEYFVYEDDIKKSPYEGPDRPEMLRKAAGKSFFRPWMKIRNASAMVKEWNDDESIDDDISREKAADNVLDKAMQQFTEDENIKEAEIVPPEKKEDQGINEL